MKHNTRKNIKKPKNKTKKQFFLIQQIPKNRLMFTSIKTQQIQYI